MQTPPDTDPTLSRLTRWGEAQPLVRAMLLTSTRSVPGGVYDIYSDYDVILGLSDVRPFCQRDWLAAFGRVLVMYQDPLEEDGGLLHSGNVVQFEGGLKIDFTLLQARIFHKIASAEPIPGYIGEQRAELDAGYLVLLDKDGLTAALPPPTYRAFLPEPPSQARYLEEIELGLLDATYVARYLWRDDLMAAREIFVHYMTEEHVRLMLEWHYASERGWSVKPGPHGRRMKRYLRPDLWAGFEATFRGPSREDGWQALFHMLDLFRKAAEEVGQRLGYAYPAEIERKVVAYLEEIKSTKPNL